MLLVVNEILAIGIVILAIIWLRLGDCTISMVLQLQGRVVMVALALLGALTAIGLDLFPVERPWWLLFSAGFLRGFAFVLLVTLVLAVARDRHRKD